MGTKLWHSCKNKKCAGNFNEICRQPFFRCKNNIDIAFKALENEEEKERRIKLGYGKVLITECIEKDIVCIILSKEGVQHPVGTICSNEGKETLEDLNPDVVIEFANIEALEVLQDRLNQARNIFVGKHLIDKL